jgi:hypothetical protein
MGWSFKAPGNALAVLRVLPPFVARGVIANPLQLDPDCPKCARENGSREDPQPQTQALLYTRFAGPHGVARNARRAHCSGCR